jgi:hypothetical protein
MRLCIVLALVLILATSAFALEKKAYQMRDDFGAEPLQGSTTLNYYYYIPSPCPGGSSWFWAYSGWAPGTVIGECFTIGDQGTVLAPPADPATYHTLTAIRILDFAGYGTVYPGLFTMELDVYCGQPACCDVAPVLHLWNSGPLECHFALNVFEIPGEGLCLTDCYDPAEPFNVVVTMTMTGTDASYPAVGMDNISSNLTNPDGCPMHDYGCLPAVFPRYACGAAQGPNVHSGYIGAYPFEFWPMDFFCDGADTTPDCTQFGAIEFCWRLYLLESGPTATEPSSWGNIKSMYR